MSDEIYASGDIPVDSGRILIVDPCHIPADLLIELQERGLGTVFVTPYGDGWMNVLSVDQDLIVVPSIAMEAVVNGETPPEGNWRNLEGDYNGS